MADPTQHSAFPSLAPGEQFKHMARYFEARLQRGQEAANVQIQEANQRAETARQELELLRQRQTH